jgi:hypothetical protein
MAEKQQRKGFLGATDRLIALLDGVKGIAMILAALSVGGASGTLMASDKDTAIRVDTLEKRVDSVSARQDRMERRQMEMFSAQIEADTVLRGILEHRAANKRRAAEDRADTEKMFNDILGGSQ